MPKVFDSSGLVRWRPPPIWTGKVFSETDLPPWEFLVDRGGAEGRAWLQDYFAAGWDELKTRAEAAVQQVRERRFDAARAEFQAVWHDMQECRRRHPEGMAITERWYHSGVAYLRYKTADFEGAWRAVDRTEEAVQRAVRALPLLLPLAHHCVEFPFLYARIAREQRRWDEVALQAARLHALATDRRPLCFDAAGEPVFMSTLDEHFLSLPCLTPDELEFLRHLLVKETRIQRLGAVTRELYALPWTVVPYP